MMLCPAATINSSLRSGSSSWPCLVPEPGRNSYMQLSYYSGCHSTEQSTSQARADAVDFCVSSLPGVELGGA